jgi:hypothetical protein
MLTMKKLDIAGLQKAFDGRLSVYAAAAIGGGAECTT